MNHIYHGDCREILETFPEKSVDLIFADPPYNLQLRQELWRPNMTRVDAVDDEWDQFPDFAAYDQFTREWLRACRRVLKDTGTIWVIGTYHNIYRVGTILQDLGFWVLNDVVFVKSNPMPNFRGVRFTNAHETLLWCKKTRDQKRYTFNYHAMKALNEGKQMRSDWEMPLCTGAERLRVNGEKLHTAQKPEALLYRVILASSQPGDCVLDVFLGTGTTAAAAKRLGRQYIGIEQDVRYVEAARARLAAIPSPSHDAELYRQMESRRTARRVPFGALVAHGWLLPGQVLFFKRQPTQTATIMADGSVRLEDGARGSIHQMGARVAGTPTCNGWEHWYYQDEQGEFGVIDALRERYRQMSQQPQATEERANGDT
jgi:DNA modification methylase